jgi:hypothetical protein
MRTVSRLKQTLKEAARATRRAARTTDSGRVNVTGRKNVRIVANVGRTSVTNEEMNSHV